MIDNLIKEWIHQEMSFLKNLFKGKPAQQNTDDQVSLLIPQVRQVFAEIKSSTQISWTVILPTASRVAAFLLSNAQGLDDALKMYKHRLDSIEATERIPPGAILDIKAPPSTPEEHMLVKALLLEFANARLGEGFHGAYIGLAMGATTELTAKMVVDTTYMTWLVKQSYEELVSGGIKL